MLFFNQFLSQLLLAQLLKHGASLIIIGVVLPTQRHELCTLNRAKPLTLDKCLS